MELSWLGYYPGFRSEWANVVDTHLGDRRIFGSVLADHFAIGHAYHIGARSPFEYVLPGNAATIRARARSPVWPAGQIAHTPSGTVVEIGILNLDGKIFLG